MDDPEDTYVRLRLRQIALIAPRLQPVVEDFRDVLGLEVCFGDPGVGHFGLENALLPLGNQFIELLAPIREDTAGGRYLERRGGAGGYMFIIQCKDHGPHRDHLGELGVRLVTDHRSDTFVNMQLHPKDTGGTFLEIDQQIGPRGMDPDGPWTPAGGDGWQRARRVHRVANILAAEIQAEDPAATAERWGEILQQEVVDADNPCLYVDNAGVRFVPCTDGRPEGLAGLDLLTVDRGAVLAAAKARGCAVDATSVMLCGMRVNLT